MALTILPWAITPLLGLALPVQHPEQLVRFEWTGSFSGTISAFGGDASDYFSYPMYKDLQDRNKVLSGLLATMETNVALSQGGRAEDEDAAGPLSTLQPVRSTSGGRNTGNMEPTSASASVPSFVNPGGDQSNSGGTAATDPQTWLPNVNHFDAFDFDFEHDAAGPQPSGLESPHQHTVHQSRCPETTSSSVPTHPPRGRPWVLSDTEAVPMPERGSPRP